jgi:hypothetical protein
MAPASKDACPMPRVAYGLLAVMVLAPQYLWPNAHLIELATAAVGVAALAFDYLRRREARALATP